MKTWAGELETHYAARDIEITVNLLIDIYDKRCKYRVHGDWKEDSWDRSGAAGLVRKELILPCIEPFQNRKTSGHLVIV